jgi:hypothetical protein
MMGWPATAWDDEDPPCDISGRCEGQAWARQSRICSCTHCGKELHYRDGAWWTWDADQYEHPSPQHEAQDVDSKAIPD